MINLNPILSAHAADSGIVQGLDKLIPGGLENILFFGITVGAVIALGVIIYAGILYSMSGDNSSKQKEAREWIFAAVKGLAVLIFGYAIILIMNPKLTTIDEIQIPELSYSDDTPLPYSAPSLSTGGVGNPLPSISIGSSVYGMRCHPTKHCCRKHGGVDLRANCDTDVLAVKNGKVYYRSDPDGYGRYIVIAHSDGTFSYYAHLSRYISKNGAVVKKSDVIAKSGGDPTDSGSGASTGCHLHFEIRNSSGGETNVNLLFGVDSKRIAMESSCPKGATCNKSQDCNGNPK